MKKLFLSPSLLWKLITSGKISNYIWHLLAIQFHVSCHVGGKPGARPTPHKLGQSLWRPGLGTGAAQNFWVISPAAGAEDHHDRPPGDNPMCDNFLSLPPFFPTLNSPLEFCSTKTLESSSLTLQKCLIKYANFSKIYTVQSQCESHRSIWNQWSNLPTVLKYKG